MTSPVLRAVLVLLSFAVVAAPVDVLAQGPTDTGWEIKCSIPPPPKSAQTKPEPQARRDKRRPAPPVCVCVPIEK